MEHPGKISPRQATGLLVTLVLGTGVLFIPGITLKNAHRGAWLAMLIAILAGMMLALILRGLIRKQPSLTLTEHLVALTNATFGRILASGFAFFLFYGAILVLREGSVLVHVVFLPETPLSVIMIGLSVLSLYGAWLGLESLARMNALYLPLFFLSFIGIFFGSLTHAHWSQMWPPWEMGLSSLIKGAFVPLAWVGETSLILLMVSDIHGTPVKKAQVPLGAVAILGTFLVVNTIIIQIVLGWKLASTYPFPLLEIGRAAFSSENLRGFDALILTIWVMGVIQKLTLWFYYSIKELGNSLQLSNPRTLFVPGAVLLYILGLTSMDNIQELTDALVRTWPLLAMGTFEGIIPIFLLIRQTWTFKIRQRRA